MLEPLLATSYGLLGGILVGLLPGLGTTTFLLLSFPILAEQSLLFCIIFYCVLSSSSQYFGSITTLSFGIPGENTSIPLFSIREKILKQDLLSSVYFLCASGSFIASLVSWFIFYLTIDIYLNIVYLKSYVSLICGILGILLCIIFSYNKLIISILFLFFGWIFARIGYDDIYNINFLTFENPYLYAGLPTLPVLMGIYAIPSLLITIKESSKINQSPFAHITNSLKVVHILENKWVILRSSVIGYVAGLVPYIGNGISSFLAFSLERKIQPFNYLAQATAAESANNSANLSVLIPLLLLGVAIIPSEFVLLEILLSSNQYFQWSTLQDNYLQILLCLLMANCLSFYFSWKCVNTLNKIVLQLKKYLYITFILIIIFSIWIFGYQYSQGIYYISVLIFFSFIGFILRNYDLLPFTFGFLLQNNIEHLIYRTYQIYF